ncbi:hypothetical protein GQR58_004971 [Nymphon striatum]|nr:hypothetical protein GQR58_004971 [Nymphon striatum]
MSFVRRSVWSEKMINITEFVERATRLRSGAMTQLKIGETGKARSNQVWLVYWSHPRGEIIFRFLFANFALGSCWIAGALRLRLTPRFEGAIYTMGRLVKLFPFTETCSVMPCRVPRLKPASDPTFISRCSVQIGNWKFEVGRVFNLPNAIKKSGEIWQHRVLKLAKASPSCEGIIEVMDFEAGGKLKRKEKHDKSKLRNTKRIQSFLLLIECSTPPGVYVDSIYEDCYNRVRTVLENWVFLEKYLNFEISPLGLGLNVPCLIYNCHPVEIVKEFKYLGIILDNKLSLLSHISSICYAHGILSLRILKCVVLFMTVWVDLEIWSCFVVALKEHRNGFSGSKRFL